MSSFNPDIYSWYKAMSIPSCHWERIFTSNPAIMSFFAEFEISYWVFSLSFRFTLKTSIRCNARGSISGMPPIMNSLLCVYVCVCICDVFLCMSYIWSGLKSKESHVATGHVQLVKGFVAGRMRTFPELFCQLLSLYHCIEKFCILFYRKWCLL